MQVDQVICQGGHASKLLSQGPDHGLQSDGGALLPIGQRAGLLHLQARQPQIIANPSTQVLLMTRAAL